MRVWELRNSHRRPARRPRNSHQKLSVVRVLDDFDETQQPKSVRVAMRVCPSASTSSSMDSRPWPTTASSMPYYPIFGDRCGITTRYARGSAARICSAAGVGGSSVRVETRVRDDRRPRRRDFLARQSRMIENIIQ